MKIGIIYDGKIGIDWSISSFKKEFEERGTQVVLFDINNIEGYEEVASPQNADFPQIQKLIKDGYTIWMDRIYPSDVDNENINKVLNLISWLNTEGYTTINPLTACAADYDKFFAYQLMKKYNISTPKTLRITKEKSVTNYLEDISLPCIIKRNTGGKGIGVDKINTFEELAEILRKEELMSNEYLIQQFIPSIVNHDVRVGVINGQALISYGRTLVKNNDTEPWLGSCNHGSKMIDYEASEVEKKIAIAASKAIGATLNEVDIQITSNGPVIIENNPTPGYHNGAERLIELIVNHILEINF